MNAMRFFPAALHGVIQAPPSKSDAHRKLIAAALCDTPCRIEGVGMCDDVRATCACLEALGAKLSMEGSETLCNINVTPITADPLRKPALFCGQSGSTLRFLLPVTAALYAQASLSAQQQLNARPLAALIKTMAENGVQSDASHTPLHLLGRLKSGLYTLPGNLSSQYISGLLFALPLLHGDSRIRLETPLSSAGYVQMTLQTLESFGIIIHPQQDGYLVPGDQHYRAPKVLRVQGDWSGAAFLLCAGALAGPVRVCNLQRDSLQRDAQIADILHRFGAQVDQDTDSCTVRRGELCAISLDADDIPDLVPPIAAVAAFAHGCTRIENCARLRMKESDRLQSVCQTLCALGARASVCADALHIEGCIPGGGTADSFDDHRIAMMTAVLASACQKPSTLTRPMAITKSYPAFYADYQTLGGKTDGVLLW